MQVGGYFLAGIPSGLIDNLQKQLVFAMSIIRLWRLKPKPKKFSSQVVKGLRTCGDLHAYNPPG
jgi:hypothetical protein